MRNTKNPSEYKAMHPFKSFSLRENKTYFFKVMHTQSPPLTQTHSEMAKVHTSFTQVEVQILMFKNTLVKVEVLTKHLYSRSMGFEMYLSKKYP